MAYQADIFQIDPITVMAECGPMRLMIRAWHGRKPAIDLALQAGHQALGYLERVAGQYRRLGRPYGVVDPHLSDALAIRMMKSVQAVGDTDLTPMAAVAGSIADAVADWIFDQGVSRVVVENGGDIAVRLSNAEKVEVGVRPSLISLKLTHRICLDDRRPGWGVATSGLGGRSLIRGIASAVTVLAESASVADAAATAIANACMVKDERIFQKPAEQIDPSTDLECIPVTVGVGELPQSQQHAALQKALVRAEQLTCAGVITDALVALIDNFGISVGIEPYVHEIRDPAVCEPGVPIGVPAQIRA